MRCANGIEAFRYRFVDGQVLIPVSVQAHHSFVDGLHIGQFVEQLQRFLNEW
jgi:chloramphenicol O-acetyltransferase type B